MPFFGQQKTADDEPAVLLCSNLIFVSVKEFAFFLLHGIEGVFHHIGVREEVAEVALALGEGGNHVEQKESGLNQSAEALSNHHGGQGEAILLGMNDSYGRDHFAEGLAVGEIGGQNEIEVKEETTDGFGCHAPFREEEGVYRRGEDARKGARHGGID